MKPKPKLGGDFDPERFIGASTADPSAARQGGKGKPAAEGFVRTSFDLPESIYRQLKVHAAQEGTTMKDVILGALQDRLSKT